MSKTLPKFPAGGSRYFWLDNEPLDEDDILYVVHHQRPGCWPFTITVNGDMCIKSNGAFPAYAINGWARVRGERRLKACKKG